MWDGAPNAIKLRLFEPGGIPVSPGDPGVTYGAPSEINPGSLVETYHIASPVPGEWSIRVEALSSPNGGQPYVVVLALGGTVHFRFDTSAMSVRVGQSVDLTATVQEGTTGIGGVNVNVTITKPNGSTVAASLADLGLGNYGSTFSDTGSCGIYRLDVTAQGTVSSGPFVRESSVLLSVQVPDDGAGDPCSADDDGDGFNDNAEWLVGTRPDKPCGNDGWPADLQANNKLDIGDLNSFLFPLRANGSFNKFGHPVPDPEDAHIARWNLESSGSGAGIINIGDLNALNPAVLSPTARPPMFGGEPAFLTDVWNGVGGCPYPP